MFDCVTDCAKTFEHLRHRVLLVPFKFQRKRPLEPNLSEGFQRLDHVELSCAHDDILSLLVEVLEVTAKDAWTHHFEGFDGIDSRANEVPQVRARADARIQVLDCGKDPFRLLPAFVLRPVIVDRDLNVISLTSL